MEENINSSVITQNGEYQQGSKKKTKHTKFSDKKNILPHDTYIYGYCLSVCEAGRSGREDSKR